MRPDETHIFGSMDWQKAQRHKRFRSSGIVKHRRVYSSRAHGAAMQAERDSQIEKERIDQLMFVQDTSDINYLKQVYLMAHPRATFSE